MQQPSGSDSNVSTGSSTPTPISGRRTWSVTTISSTLPRGQRRDTLTQDLDQAIRYLADQQHATPGKPFLLYLATGAMHAPHQVPPEWIDRYAGHFDDGWERWRERAFERQVRAGIVPEGTVLTERPPWVQPWEGLPADERRLYARMQEVFAGFLSHTDHHLGRLFTFLEESGTLANTVVVVLSDNGASAEGES